MQELHFGDGIHEVLQRSRILQGARTQPGHVEDAREVAGRARNRRQRSIGKTFYYRELISSSCSEDLSSPVWTALFNPDMVACSDAACTGVLKWKDAVAETREDFTFVPGYK